MKKTGFSGWMSITMSAMVLMVAGCNHPTTNPPAPTATSSTTANANVTGPAKPAATADDNTWGTYLSEQGKSLGKDVPGHPYIYLIPAGDSDAATARRKEEAQSIGFSIGPIVIPGSLLVLGGPDAQQTNAFAATLPAMIKAHALKGIVVLIVSDTTQKDALTKAFAPTDATLRFVTM